MGNTCKPMAVLFQCMTKFTTNEKKKKSEKKRKKEKAKKKKKMPVECIWMLKAPSKGIRLETVSLSSFRMAALGVGAHLTK